LLIADFGLLIGNHVRLKPDATAALVTQVSLQSRSAIIGNAKCGSVIQQLEDAPLDNATPIGNQQPAISNLQSAICNTLVSPRVTCDEKLFTMMY
jgi:hypothetical protein